jgi:hypothetical protein
MAAVVTLALAFILAEVLADVLISTAPLVWVLSTKILPTAATLAKTTSDLFMVSP